MQRSFGITYDYLCPFARNANEHVIEGLRAGAPWDVRFLPYSLSQGHVGDDDIPVWDRESPDSVAGILALQVGLAVRDHFSDRFLDVHEMLFAARHDEGRDIKDPDVLRATLTPLDIDVDAVFDIVADGLPMKVLREEHEAGVRDHSVWGVPTFLSAGRAVFARLLDRPNGDGDLASRRVHTVLDLLEGEPMLHEFKQTVLTQ